MAPKERPASAQPRDLWRYVKITAVTLTNPLRVAPSVQAAIANGEGVVALESTVVTHGLPKPQNLELARRLEATVRAAGAVPATVGVIAGELVVGLDDHELTQLANGGADKASLWNLAALAASHADAGTTVATTLFAAHQAGIAVFATGGIGGVHDSAFDESADLTALARYPLLVVCAGPKSILDASATLERLETLGVPVVGYRSRFLAGFVVPLTKLPLPSIVRTPQQAADVLQAQRALGLSAGVVLSRPVSVGLSAEEFAGLLAEAQASAQREGVHGRDTTPFLLEALATLSEGRTLEVNLRLLEENARLAAEVAVAFVASQRRTVEVA